MPKTTFDPALPHVCGARLPSDNSPILLRRGMAGFYVWPSTWQHMTPEKFNLDNGITDAQREAMVTGSMFGWDKPGAQVATMQAALDKGAERIARRKAREGRRRPRWSRE